jgi:hypothetical protein
MAENKKPASLRPAGFGGLDKYSTSRLAEKIAKYQREVEQADPEDLRSYGRTKFLEDREREINDRALAVALFGMDRCAGCRFYFPRDGYHAGVCRRTDPKLRGYNDTRSTEWCGRHEPILGGGR